jgi:gluconolactonase
MNDPAFDQHAGREVVPAGAVLERVATGATWGEGPLWLPKERVVRWSDIPGNRILDFEPSSGRMRVHRTEVEYTNGRTLDAFGRIIQCSHGRRGIEMETDAGTVGLVDRWRGLRLNSPNDVVVKSDGTIWFSDPSYGITLPQEGHPGAREYGDHFVFQFDPQSGQIEPVVVDIEDPNGLAFSPDEHLLYVSDTSGGESKNARGNHHIRVYDVKEGQSCKNGRTFVVVEPGVPDGIRVDREGRVWASSADSVQVFEPSGERVARIPVPERVGNLCFGGEGGQDLYVTATTSLYRIATTTLDATHDRLRRADA